MRRVLAVGIVSLIAGLTGCHQKQAPLAAVQENPPPIPPDCPNLPELSNVALRDGKIIDVRIIQVDDVKLYVPASWLGLFDSSPQYKAYGNERRRFNPYIRATECPGVVHKWVNNEEIFDFGFRFVLRDYAINTNNFAREVLPNFSSETKVDDLSIVRPGETTDRNGVRPNMFVEEIEDWPTSDSTSAWIVLVPNHLTGRFRWPKSKPVGSPEWNRARADVIDLFAWIRTAPKYRDNNRVFKLGA